MRSSCSAAPGKAAGQRRRDLGRHGHAAGARPPRRLPRVHRQGAGHQVPARTSSPATGSRTRPTTSWRRRCATNEDIDLVYGHNDPMAYGAYLAAKDVGREKDIKFIGIDALPDEGVMWVNNGELAATFLYATPGAEGLRQALKLLNGEKVEKTVVLDTDDGDQGERRRDPEGQRPDLTGAPQPRASAAPAAAAYSAEALESVGPALLQLLEAPWPRRPACPSRRPRWRSRVSARSLLGLLGVLAQGGDRLLVVGLGLRRRPRPGPSAPDAP